MMLIITTEAVVRKVLLTVMGVLMTITMISAAVPIFLCIV